jgi:hypothetical protein
MKSIYSILYKFKILKQIKIIRGIIQYELFHYNRKNL